MAPLIAVRLVDHMLRHVNSNVARLLVRSIYVIVDDMRVTNERMYLAKLAIRRDHRSFLVDVRPSDALTLAVILDAPILVADKLLKANETES